MKMNCRLDMPYPAVRVNEKNLHYADILMPLYAGANGELTSIATYGYQSLISENENKRLSDILECISIAEMQHFHILGKLITKLGTDPILCIRPQRGRMQYWSSYYADHSKEPYRFLKNNIEAEKKSIISYNNAFKEISDKNVRDILDRIIADEEHHIKIFTELMK